MFFFLLQAWSKSDQAQQCGHFSIALDWFLKCVHRSLLRRVFQALWKIFADHWATSPRSFVDLFCITLETHVVSEEATSESAKCVDLINTMHGEQSLKTHFWKWTASESTLELVSLCFSHVFNFRWAAEGQCGSIEDLKTSVELSPLFVYALWMCCALRQLKSRVITNHRHKQRPIDSVDDYGAR